MISFLYGELTIIYKYEDEKLMWRREGSGIDFQKSNYKSMADAIKMWSQHKDKKIILLKQVGPDVHL